ncbi:lamin tail domain-containing protein [Chryseobacterium sp. JJR-5R]|uniref:lamin tail domain-containing protein n=1 Tax=Chryseobacterium sp. JJR-5R TaxID=3093923 RepID=UPI002A75A370|nr:lamin tail domain-containing protein [Chryseobacterium sp. JJR-5R]WPO82180.1 lamin tail domain-containing protein [Chryseobacterium sp. JJR-5R]
MKKISILLGIVSIAASAHAQIVISEIYGGGGDAGSTLINDYVILKNTGAETVSLRGATLQYADADGTFDQYHILPDITLSSGQSYLIQEGSGGGGVSSLPAPDFIAGNILYFYGSQGQNASAGLNLNMASGKIALAGNTLQVTNTDDAHVIDFAAYGTSVQFAGTTAGLSPTAATAFKRVLDNTAGTNTNTADFIIAPVNPVNSTAGTQALADVDFNYSKFNFIVNPFVKDNNDIVFGGEVQNVKIYDEFGQVVMQSPTKTSYGLNLTELPKGKYTVNGMINNSPVSQRIVRD